MLAAFGPQGADRPGLRRAQARALDTDLGDGVARRLVAEKVAAQAETLVGVDRLAPVADVAVRSLRSAAAALHVAVGRDEIRVAEARAAASYWSAWSAVPVRYARRDPGVVPEHWRTFGGRASALTGSPRVATNPANAVLNILYALLEGEATIAARIVGLDPGLDRGTPGGRGNRHNGICSSVVAHQQQRAASARKYRRNRRWFTERDGAGRQPKHPWGRGG